MRRLTIDDTTKTITNKLRITFVKWTLFYGSANKWNKTLVQMIKPGSLNKSVTFFIGVQYLDFSGVFGLFGGFRVLWGWTECPKVLELTRMLKNTRKSNEFLKMSEKWWFGLKKTASKKSANVRKGLHEKTGPISWLNVWYWKDLRLIFSFLAHSYFCNWNLKSLLAIGWLKHFNK